MSVGGGSVSNEDERGHEVKVMRETSECSASPYNVELCRSRFHKCRWAAAPYRKVRQGAAAHLLP